MADTVCVYRYGLCTVYFLLLTFLDIDIGIKGLPPEKFFRVYAKLDNDLSNLVDFDENYKYYNLLNPLSEVVEIR
jgi:hypothetical protein